MTPSHQEPKLMNSELNGGKKGISLLGGKGVSTFHLPSWNLESNIGN